MCIAPLNTQAKIKNRVAFYKNSVTVLNMDLLTLRQTDLIVSSIRKVFETNDINHLSSSAYKFLNLSSGFIAHYNLYGFRDAYDNVNDLKAQLAQSYAANQWSNFRPGERDYSYMMQKKEIYNRICSLFQNEGYELNRSW
jgi:hypothetical protein